MQDETEEVDKGERDASLGCRSKCTHAASTEPPKQKREVHIAPRAHQTTPSNTENETEVAKGTEKKTENSTPGNCTTHHKSSTKKISEQRESELTRGEP